MSEAQDRVSPIGLRNNYHRPNQNWECGNLQFGCPCAHGPSSGGQCLSNTECSPIKESDTWVCTRPMFRGGGCENGPDEKGNCCQSRPLCSPKRSLRYRRRMFCIGLTTATLGLLLILFGTRPMQEIIVPGPLSSGHAELLMHQGAGRCAACHANAHQSVGQWVGQLVGFGEKPTTTQSQLCIECHKATMDSATATFAHNLPPDVLSAKTILISNRPTTQVSLTDAFLKADFQANSQISCSTCHREHHGSQVDMKTMTDLQCQSCHVQSLGHFESSHPAFELTAKAKVPSIVFDHKSHGLKHFAQANKEFACASCHRDDSSGNVKQLVGYENACASCHDGPIQLSGQKGLALLQLPMIDPEAIKSANVNFGHWPEELSADFDGKIDGLTRVLLEADPQARQAFYILGEDRSWMDLDPANEKQMQAVGDVLLGLKRLLVDLSARGNEAIEQRLQVAFQRKLRPEEKVDLGYGLSPDLFRDARQRWFPDLLQEIELDLCFPIFGQTKREEQALSISNPILGKLDPKFFQDLLAENPLSGQFAGKPQVEMNPSTTIADPSANAKQAASPNASIPAHQLDRQSSSVSSSTGQLLAPNPLSGSAVVQSSDSSTGIANRPSNDSRSAIVNQQSTVVPQGPLASSGGELLAENPLAGQFSAATVVEQNAATEVIAVTEPKPTRQVAQQDSSEDSDKLKAIIAKHFGDTKKQSGWARDDQTFSIHYQMSGHADPILKSWIQLAANQRTEANSGQQAALVLFNALASPTSSGTCMQCHVANGEVPATPIDHPDNLVALGNIKMDAGSNRAEGKPNIQLVSSGQLVSGGQLVSSGGQRLSAPTQLAPFRQISATLENASVNQSFSWKATYRDPMIRQFTNFNHRPHTLQSGLGDCVTCHKMIEPTAVQLTSETKTLGIQSDFHPMTNNNCATCHRSGGTSDSCTTCHSYHVGSRRLQ